MFLSLFIKKKNRMHNGVPSIPQTKVWRWYKIFFFINIQLIIHRNPNPNPSPNHNLSGDTILAILAILAADCV